MNRYVASSDIHSFLKREDGTIETGELNLIEGENEPYYSLPGEEKYFEEDDWRRFESDGTNGTYTSKDWE